MMIKRKALLASAALLSLASAGALFAAELTDTDILAQADNYFRYIKLTKTQIEDIFINGKTKDGKSVDEATKYIQYVVDGEGNTTIDAPTAAEAVAKLIDGNTPAVDDEGEDLHGKVDTEFKRFGYGKGNIKAEIAEVIRLLDHTSDPKPEKIRTALDHLFQQALGDNTALPAIDKTKLDADDVRGLTEQIKDLIDGRLASDANGAQDRSQTLIDATYKIHSLLVGEDNFGVASYETLEEDIAAIMGRDPTETTDITNPEWGGLVGSGNADIDAIRDLEGKINKFITEMNTKLLGVPSATTVTYADQDTLAGMLDSLVVTP